MATMNVSLPETLKEFVETQVSERGYGTSSEFVRHLIRREQARMKLRDLVLDGMTSGPGSELDDGYFERLGARIGRELEASPGAGQQDIARVLAGDGSYDDLGECEQAVVRAVWSERIAARREALNYTEHLLAAGESWTEADEHRNMVGRES